MKTYTITYANKQGSGYNTVTFEASEEMASEVLRISTALVNGLPIDVSMVASCSH